MDLNQTSHYEILLDAILSRKFDDQSVDDLVEYVKETYTEKLKSQGVPLPSSTGEGLKQDIRDSLKAITYGFYSIKDYNDSRAGAH